MKQPALWKVSITTAAEADEAVSEILQAQLGEPACVYTNAETKISEVSSFLKSKPDWPTCQLELSRRLREIKSSYLSFGPARLSLVRVPHEDWAKSWKRHFHPLEIGSKLLIKPSWSNRRPRKGQSVVLLDPGLSFGTGHHPTTLFCLRELVAHRRAGQPQSFLDVGTGSGILAIAAARLGYAPIEAWDCEAEALRVARANASLNGVSRRIRFCQRDLAKAKPTSGRRFCVICANLASDLLIDHRHRILSQLQATGVLVAAGILRREFVGVRKSYETTGLRLEHSGANAEWRSGTFRQVC
jgi:ribosomal protein L11 methyltransferase